MTHEDTKKTRNIKAKYRNGDIGGEAQGRAEGIRSPTEIERTRKETEKEEDSWIKRGRKCPVMLG